MAHIQHTYQDLVKDIGNLLSVGKAKAAQRVNTVLVHTYWNIGKRVVEYEQQGNEKAEYGSEILSILSKDLKDKYGKGFGKSKFIRDASALS